MLKKIFIRELYPISRKCLYCLNSAESSLFYVSSPVSLFLLRPLPHFYPSHLLSSDGEEYLPAHKCPSDCGCSPGWLAPLTERDLECRVKYRLRALQKPAGSSQYQHAFLTQPNNVIIYSGFSSALPLFQTYYFASLLSLYLKVECIPGILPLPQTIKSI